MQNDNCVFCKIINNQLPATKVWENENFLAILNLFPNTKGVTILLAKQHLTANVFENEDTLLQEAIVNAKIVAKKLVKGLKADRVCLIGEGLEIDHFHLKLYPVYNVQKYFKNSKGKEFVPEYSVDYQGYLSTKEGPMADRGELERVGELVSKA